MAKCLLMNERNGDFLRKVIFRIRTNLSVEENRGERLIILLEVDKNITPSYQLNLHGA